jgi:hypothetical protein
MHYQAPAGMLMGCHGVCLVPGPGSMPGLEDIPTGPAGPVSAAAAVWCAGAMTCTAYLTLHHHDVVEICSKCVKARACSADELCLTSF